VSIEVGALPDARTGVWFEEHVVARGPNPPLSWRVVEGRLPDGLSLDAASGRIEGFPRREASFRFTVQVEDGLEASAPRDGTVAAARAAFDLRVRKGPLAVLPLPVPSLSRGAAFAHRFEAAGGTPPRAFSLAGGALPPGTSLAPDGLWRGVPLGAGGPVSLRVRATDAEGATAEAPFETHIVVLPLAVRTLTPSEAALGCPFSATAAVKPGGAGPPYAWAVAPAGGGLPPGLSIDDETGEIAGTPLALGTFAFRLEATDASGQTAGRDVEIRVNPSPVLSEVDPISLPPRGAPVALLGFGFRPGLTVRFGAAEPVEAEVLDASRASVVPPEAAGESGWVDVGIRNPDGGEGSKAKAFRYPLRTVEFVPAGVKGTPRGLSRGIAAGDVDGDGLCDLVHVGSAGIETIRPVGPAYSGAWVGTSVRSDGSYCDVRLADVDADGDLDVVALRTSTTETVEVFRNPGTGVFASTPWRTTTYEKPPTNHNPNSLAVGDVDGDGVVDVAVTSSRGNQGAVWTFRGLGDGSFSLVHAALDSVYEAAGGLFCANGVLLADVDGDGRDDLLVSDGFPSACALGQSCPTTPSSGGTPNPHPGGNDFVAWVSLSQPGGAPGAWRVARLEGGTALLNGCNEGLVATDWDGDARLDLAVLGGYRDLRGTGVAFLAGDGTGAFAERLVVATAYGRRFGAAIDANLDGYGDAIVVGGDGSAAEGDGSDFSVAECWVGAADVPLRAWASGPEDATGGSLPGANPGRVAVGDFDGDGLSDFAVDQSFQTKERFPNEQADGIVRGVAVYLNRSR
jgi:hypothetical protein